MLLANLFVRTEMETGFADRQYLDVGNSHKPTIEKRTAFRRMMFCYWETASPFPLDVVGTVIRQGTFAETMQRVKWIY